MSNNNSGFKPILGKQNPLLSAYQHKIKQQAEWIKTVQAVLPESLAVHVVYCVLSEKNLLVYVDSEEAIAQLESYQAMLLAAMAYANPALVERVIVRLFSDSMAQKSKTSAKLPSKKNIELLQENLQAVQDEGLKQALSRLSRTLERLSKT